MTSTLLQVEMTTNLWCGPKTKIDLICLSSSFHLIKPLSKQLLGVLTNLVFSAQVVVLLTGASSFGTLKLAKKYSLSTPALRFAT